MSAPKVLHIHFGKEGGAERFFVNLAKAFDRRGVEQRFAIRPNRSWEGEIAALGPVIRDNYRYLSLSRFWLEWKLRQTCRTWQPDAILAWMPRAARAIPDWPGAVKMTRLGDYPQHLDHFQRCDALVANTPDIIKHCQGLGWKKAGLVISNFARPVTPKPVSRAAHDTPNDAFLIAGAGRFVNRKGLDLAIRAAAGVDGAYLWLIGDGKERPVLESLAQEVGIAERTRFIGWVDEPVHHLAAADAVAFPSRHEPLGNVILDAWQAGVPVVSTRAEGPDWFLRNETDGIMVEIDDLEGLTAGLQSLKDDPALRAKYAAAGPARLAEMFSEDAVVDAYLAAFRGELTR
ncbi:glycosyltransferase [Rhodobacteraceae bacterium N5(2021)]|uniref:Glycosyltransferase n=1 Tax=Gymnodinialimonas phycosphaerae TaxID=2841589 RepID=A0A975TSH9_9RHOB|nr:glycosyltransferase [Gymnodinialimonas phycosphaerae]MBY4893708.1 glycosyltransferase [Gymnodinialimonas phycosphaerae]